MQNTFNIEDIVNASIIVSQKNPDKKQFKKAEQYLIDFQKSAQAWSTTYQILSMENQNLAVYAQVSLLLKQKLQYDFHQVPEGDYLTITKAILELLMKHDHKSVTKPLSYCFVLLYMRIFETLGDLIDLLKETLFNDHKKELIGLSMLKLVVELVFDENMIIEKTKKERFVNYLSGVLQPKVFQLLDNIGKNGQLGEDHINKLLDTFFEWFYFSRKDENLINILSRHSCFSLALLSMNTSSLAENAGAVIKQIIKSVKKPEEHSDIFEAIFNNVLGYIPECNKAMKDDLDHVQEYIQVFRCFGIRFAKTILRNPTENLLKFLQYMVELTANQDLFVEALTELEEFWEEFCDAFEKVYKKKETQQPVSTYQEMFTALILILIKRMQLSEAELQKMEEMVNKSENDSEEEADDEEEETEDNDKSLEYDLEILEEKRKERNLCQNIIAHVQEIYGFQDTFNIVLREVGSSLRSDWQNFTVSDITKFECLLFAAKACIIGILKSEDPDLNEFFKIVMDLKLQGVKLNRTKILLIEEAAERTKFNNELTSEIFKYMAECLENEKLKDDASDALITLCGNWSDFVLKNFNDFIQLSNRHNNDENIIIALTTAISYSDGSEENAKYLAQLVYPFLTRILECTKLPNATTDKTIIKEIKNNLLKFQTAFHHMPKESEQTVQLFEPVFTELWPTFLGLFNNYRHEEGMLIRLLKVLKKAIKILKLRFRKFAIEFMEIACEIFMKNPISEFLYIFEVLVGSLGEDPEFKQVFVKAYEIISESTLKFLEGKDFKEHNEFVEDFFGLLFRYAKYLPEVLLQSETLEINFRLAEISIGLDQPNVEKTLFLFLERIFKLCNSNPRNDMERGISQLVVAKYGALLINKLLTEFIKYPRTLLRTYILDTLFESFVSLKEYTLVWLHDVLKELPENILTLNEKQEMLEKLSQIDVSRLKEEMSQEDEEKLCGDIEKKFMKRFDLLEFRCKLIDRRENDLELANV